MEEMASAATVCAKDDLAEENLMFLAMTWDISTGGTNIAGTTVLTMRVNFQFLTKAILKAEKNVDTEEMNKPALSDIVSCTVLMSEEIVVVIWPAPTPSRY
jgi:hypothetical protein